LLDLHYPNPKFSICFYFDSIFACVFLMEHWRAILYKYVITSPSQMKMPLWHISKLNSHVDMQPPHIGAGDHNGIVAVFTSNLPIRYMAIIATVVIMIQALSTMCTPCVALCKKVCQCFVRSVVFCGHFGFQ
jgi:hypothetical protein